MTLSELRPRSANLPDCVPGSEVLGGDDRNPACSLSWESLRCPDGEVVVLRVAGQIDLRTHPMLGLMLIGALSRAPSHLVVDLTGVTFCHARGIALLCDIAHDAAVHGTGYALSGLPADLSRAEDALGQPGGHPVHYPTTTAALTALGAHHVGQRA